MKKIVVIALMLLLISSLLLTGCGGGGGGGPVALERLWITLRTGDFDYAGTDANLFLEFSDPARSFGLPDQPGDDLERATSTTYDFNVDHLTTEAFVDDNVSLRLEPTGDVDVAGWWCQSVLVIGVGEDGRYYPLVALPHVETTIGYYVTEESLNLDLDILERTQIGVKGEVAVGLERLWVTLRTGDLEHAGTDADLYLEFQDSGLSFRLPNQPGDDLERATSTTYDFNVDRLTTEDFVDFNVSLRNDDTGDNPGWMCQSVLIIGVGEDGDYYPLVAMTDVEKWLAYDEPEGLTLPLDTLEPDQIGVK